MKKLTINEKEYSVYDSIQNLNLDRYQKLSAVANKEMDTFDKDMEMMQCIIDEPITIKELELSNNGEIREFLTTINVDVDSDKPKKDFTHDGITYHLIGNPDNFMFNTGQIKYISQAMQKSKTGYVSRMASLLYTDGSTNENKREIIFNEYMTADYILPFLKILIDKYA